MIMESPPPDDSPMRPPMPAQAAAGSPAEVIPANPSHPIAAISPEVPAVVGRLLGERLELVEDLWLTVLRSECPPAQVDRLIRLKELSAPPTPIEEAAEGTPESGEAPISQPGCGGSEAIVAVIREMDLADGIAAASAFSLYFQLINILEQHI